MDCARSRGSKVNAGMARPNCRTALRTGCSENPGVCSLWVMPITMARCGSISFIARSQALLDAWYISQSDSLSEAALAERVAFTLIGGNRGEMTRAQMLLHVVNHCTYHRGFVADLFHQVPARPPLTDLPVYLRERGA